MRIRYAPRAAEDLENIRRFIGTKNQRAAWVVGSFIRRSIGRLARWPHSARATNDPGVRRLVVTNYPYVVYYQVEGEDVIVLTILHSGTDA